MVVCRSAARVRALAFALAVAVVAALAVASDASAATAVDVVKPYDVNGMDWDDAYTRETGSYAFVQGPGTPPLGNGSLELRTPAGNDKANLRTFAQFGLRLYAIDGLGYSTYRHAESTATPVQLPSINMEIDIDGGAIEAGDYTTLVFEPVYNTDQGLIAEDEWQHWDAYRDGQARWWSSRAIPGVCAFDCFLAWNVIVAANPDATVLSYGVNQGSGNAGLVAATDALEIGADGNGVVYDFEPLTGPPVTKDECKKGGWMLFDNPSFKNQGECVSYVASGGRG